MKNSQLDNSNNKKKDFDYFFIVLKNWKFIVTICIASALISGALLILIPKSYFVKSSFAISLPKSILSASGNYAMKTINPNHYLSKVERELFKQKVLENLNLTGRESVKIVLASESPDFKQDANYEVYPNKFDLIISDNYKDSLVEINEEAISLLLNTTDETILEDMSSQFTVNLNIEISDLNREVQTKTELVLEYENQLDIIKGQQSSDRNNIDDIGDSRLLNNVEDEDKGLVISMLLNEEKGIEFFYSAIISLEKVRLNKLKNNLKEKEILITKLKACTEKEDYLTMFKKPFSSNFIMLSSAQFYEPIKSNGSIKFLILVVFISFIVSTTIVLVREYYN
jgi:hypothetical protein